MRVTILGGPDDGAPTEIPEQMGEGQMFLVGQTQYFVHTPRDKPRQLVYYKLSQEF